MNITQMLVPDSYVFPNADGYIRKWLVLHKTAGGSTAQGVAAWFQSGADGANTSVHYVVGLDGAIVQCVRESDGAGGNCCLEAGHDTFWPTDINLNLVTFSIECVDQASDNSTPMPTLQKQSLFWLVKDICVRQSIPIQPADANGGIAGHSSIAPISRARCPGNFAWDELWAYLKEWKDLKNGGNMVPTGWQDDGATLTAPNGVKVIQGFRQWVLSHDWDADNWPETMALALNPVEQGNTGLGNGTVQPFKKGPVLAWTPKMGVYEMYIGQEYVALYKAWAKTQADLQSAQQQITLMQQQNLDAVHKQLTDYLQRINDSEQLAQQLVKKLQVPQA